MKICVVWYWDMASKFFETYRDGLKAALEEIGKEHTVIWYLDKNVPQKYDNYDFILIWSDSNCAFLNDLKDYPGRKGLCYGSTFEPNLDNLRKVDVVFVENTPMYEFIRAAGIRAIKAFGTDTDFYSPDDRLKTIPYFYPATFSPWKRQSDIAYLGNKLTCCGYMQPDGMDEYNSCVVSGVHVIPDNLPAEKVRNLYRISKEVIIPAHYGSERTVLEAMSCNIWPTIVRPDINKNAYSYIEEYFAEKEKKNLTPREFILKFYSHHIYAKQLLKGII